jgi:hypothetical protein
METHELLEQIMQMHMNECEMIRKSTYILFNMQFLQKDRMTYEDFKKKVFPLSWDDVEPTQTEQTK